MDSEQPRPTLAPTGDARVDQAIEGLADLDQIDLDERPAVLEQVHDRLREILGELGDAGRSAQGPAGAPRSPGRAGRPGEQGELGGSRPRMPARARLDAELVRRGLARSREQAAELIAAGRVAVSGQTAAKSATQVTKDTPVTVAGEATPTASPSTSRAAVTSWRARSRRSPG